MTSNFVSCCSFKSTNQRAAVQTLVSNCSCFSAMSHITRLSPTLECPRVDVSMLGLHVIRFNDGSFTTWATSFHCCVNIIEYNRYDDKPVLVSIFPSIRGKQFRRLQELSFVDSRKPVSSVSFRQFRFVDYRTPVSSVSFRQFRFVSSNTESRGSRPIRSLRHIVTCARREALLDAQRGANRHI